MEATRQLYNQWITLLDELIIPPHQVIVIVKFDSLKIATYHLVILLLGSISDFFWFCYFPLIQDFVNIRHGMRNCLMLQSPNVVKTPEDEELIKKKQEYRARQKANINN